MTTQTQQFIEDAIAGGWKSGLLELPNSYYEVDTLSRKQGDTTGVWFYHTELDLNKWPIKKSIEVLAGEILLDPLAWQAVGKQRGWFVGNDNEFDNARKMGRWHRFIDHLADGNTIEEALKEIQ